MNKPKCDCKEMSCIKDCARNHTHKGFFCSVCEPEACAKMEAEPAPEPTNQTQPEWEAELESLELDCTAHQKAGKNGEWITVMIMPNLKAFITRTIEQEREKDKRAIDTYLTNELQKIPNMPLDQRPEPFNLTVKYRDEINTLLSTPTEEKE